jgi:hypothetical protein
MVVSFCGGLMVPDPGFELQSITKNAILISDAIFLRACSHPGVVESAELTLIQRTGML